MIKNILVCLEGSPSTTAAVRLAIDVAKPLAAHLVGLAIVDEPDIRAGTPTSIGGSAFKHERDDALVADAHKHASDAMALFERRCREANVPAKALEIVGRPVDAILEEMETRDLTVLGRDVNFKFEIEKEDAQTRDTILHRASTPVLVVPEAAPPKLGGTVLVAYDGSGAAKRALSSFASSGLATGRDIHVVTIDDNGAVAWEMANRAVETLKAADIPAKGHNIVSLLSNQDVIIRLAKEIDAGLIVMGAFTRSRLRELFSGSVTRSLVDTTEIPLYLQH
ncbi:MAG TPA: universal stress protein [Polyangia bacterium]|nr:universal stress protein [Polyangia bacterium]